MWLEYRGFGAQSCRQDESSIKNILDISYNQIRSCAVEHLQSNSSR